MFVWRQFSWRCETNQGCGGKIWIMFNTETALIAENSNTLPYRLSLKVKSRIKFWKVAKSLAKLRFQNIGNPVEITFKLQYSLIRLIQTSDKHAVNVTIANALLMASFTKSIPFHFWSLDTWPEKTSIAFRKCFCG